MLLICPYENVSLIFCFLKCCENMSKRDMSQRPDRPDRIRLGRLQSSTSSAQSEKEALRPPLTGQGRGGTRLGRVDIAGGHRHRWIHQRWWTRRSISNIITRRRISLRIRRHISLSMSIKRRISLIMSILLSSRLRLRGNMI